MCQVSDKDLVHCKLPATAGHARFNKQSFQSPGWVLQVGLALGEQARRGGARRTTGGGTALYLDTDVDCT